MAYDFPNSKSPFYAELSNRGYTVVREKEFKKYHTFFDGPPNDWAADRGATHTLYCGDGPGQGTRPAKLSKTVAYVANDEDDEGKLVWSKWNLYTYNVIRVEAKQPAAAAA